MKLALITRHSLLITHPMTHFPTEIIITQTLTFAALDFVSKVYSKCFIITDKQISQLHLNSLQTYLAPHLPVFSIIMPQGEQCKTIENASKCWQEMHSSGLDRKSVVIGLGGGAITDLAGFVAGCYMRGNDVIFLPTTLLGMVDAAIGGKAGVNLPQGKNLVGIFHHPKLVLMSMHYLKTLNDRDFIAGIAEVIKYGVIAKPSLFIFLESNMTEILKRSPSPLQMIIEQSTAIKRLIVEADERENGRRAILNWGHTVGHALEAASNFTYLHGEAIAIGMCCEARISQALGLVDEKFVDRLEQVCQQAHLPTKLPKEISPEKLITLMRGDKKAQNGHISMIVVEELGKVYKRDNIPEDVILRTLLQYQ